LESLTNDTVSTEEEQALARIVMFSSRVKDNKQLRSIIDTAQIGLQRQVYAQIVPHLSFKPQSFRKLMRHA
jgi:hypothetical protein